MSKVFAQTARLPQRLNQRRPLAAWALVVLVSLGLAAAALPTIEARFMAQRIRQDEATLRLVTEVLRGALSRSEALPALIAERPIFAAVLRDPDNEGLIPFANEQLRQTALSLGVSDIYVMDAQGTTIIASNYRLPRSFIGRNFAFRPYFTDAIANGIGRYHALGTTSGERGYYFAAPVFDAGRIIGAVAVKMTLDGFETAWRDGQTRVIVTDRHNVIFMSDQRDWHFRTLGPLSEAAIAEISVTQQYPLALLSPLSFEASTGAARQELVIEDPAGAGARRYILQQALIASAQLRVGVLTQSASARTEALGALAILWLAILLVALLVAVFWQRRAQLLERIERQSREAETLEARVRERTRDLAQANRKLSTEIDERIRTETRLRQTQAELVQAGKLAALGQMSAALSHEFNQPLAAVKTYAENALSFLERGREGEARDNIGRISTMADRMAAISKHLRNFARRPQEKLRPAPVGAVLRDAMDLLQARIERARAQIAITGLPPDDIWIMGGRVRLQQVVVNLVSNALDAMAGQSAPPRIEITLTCHEGMAHLALRDHGTGLDVAARDQIFDPFFTTKDVGQGLGLGLSISYNIIRDFGGKIVADNHPQGGAIFTLILPLAEESAIAAAKQGQVA